MGLFYIVCAAVISLLLYRIIQTLEQRTAVQLLPDYDDVVQFDPEREGGHLLPNLNLDVRGEFGPVHFITNSKGFRNAKEFQYTPPSNVYRILLLGDSYVDGMRTAQEQTIGAVLQEILNAHLQNTRQVEVLISGQNNPANAWYAYQEHGHKYHPELVSTPPYSSPSSSHRTLASPGGPNAEHAHPLRHHPQPGTPLLLAPGGLINVSVLPLDNRCGLPAQGPPRRWLPSARPCRPPTGPSAPATPLYRSSPPCACSSGARLYTAPPGWPGGAHTPQSGP